MTLLLLSSQPGWGARALGSVIIYQRSSLRYARSYRHTLKSHPALRFCIDFSSRQAAPCSRAHTGRRVDHELGGVAHERPRALHGARTRSPRTITPGSRRNFRPGGPVMWANHRPCPIRSTRTYLVRFLVYISLPRSYYISDILIPSQELSSTQSMSIPRGVTSG